MEKKSINRSKIDIFTTEDVYKLLIPDMSNKNG